MSPGCPTIVLLCILTLVSGLEHHVSEIKINHTEAILAPDYSQVPVREEWKVEPSVESYSKISGKHPTSQTVLSHKDDRLLDKSAFSELKYGDGTRTTDDGMKTFQSALKKGGRRGRKFSRSEIINKHHSEPTSKAYFNDEKRKPFDGHPNQPGGTKDPTLFSHNVHGSHPECHVLEDTLVDLSDHVASGLSQTTDVKSVRRSSVMMNLPCCNIGNRTADCTGCGLTCVPTDLPRNITRLLLTDNFISSKDLYDGVFVNYTQLVELWLDSNYITFLPEDVFEGLEHLQFLSLYNNTITLNMGFNNSTAFYPLNNTLKTLILSRNTYDIKNQYLVYPDKALSVLKNLSRLYIDGLSHTYFGMGFSNLTKLTHLLLDGKEGYCNMKSITNHTFNYLQHLTFLSISDCHLNGSLIEENAFSNLLKLQVLDLSYNYKLGFHAVGNIMYGLQKNTHFVQLIIKHIVDRFTPCVMIYKHTLRHFRHSSLQLIEAMNNEIEMIEEGALDMLPSTLEKLNLTGNRIMFGAYWKDMAFLTGLKELYLDGYIHVQNFPFFFPTSKAQCLEIQRENYMNYLYVKQKHGDEKCICGPGTCSSNTQSVILPLPPKLRVLTLHSRSLAYTVNGLRFCSTNNLISADLSGNTFKYLRGSVTGLYHIRNLNLSSCSIEIIGDDFLNNVTSLENLNLFQNLLGDCLHNDLEGNIFDKLTNLKTLNLSSNDLYELSEPMFRDLVNLETLDLSSNTLSKINFSIKHMRKLRFIDLHKNNIGSLPKDFTDVVDELLRANNSVKIDMSENNIYCDCINLEFLEWMVTNTEVFGDNYTNYYCEYHIKKTSSVHITRGYKDELDLLRRECGTHEILYVAAVGGTLIFVTFIIGLLLYRFRWTLRYWYHAAKMKIYSSPHQVNEEYEYDVFVSYASEDVDFVLEELSPHLSAERHIKLMIHGEKFQAGRHITDNIYMAVCQCRKTLVLVTRQMLASHWCTYELQMARMESISRGRNVLVFLFLEEIPTHLMKVDVISYIKTSTYIRYPKEVRDRDNFWNKLADDLRAQ